MAKNVDHIQHVKSSVVIEENGVFSPKLPNPSVLADGEIAVNYAEGYETLSIKNSTGDIVTFSSDNKFYTKDFIDEKLGSGFTGENSANTVTKVIEDNELTISSSLNDLNQRKLDASAYTPTDLSNYYTKSETSGASQIATALNGKADASDIMQSDWSQTATTENDYIKNKPLVRSDEYGTYIDAQGNNSRATFQLSYAEITDGRNRISLDCGGDEGIKIVANDGSDGTIELSASSNVYVATSGTNKFYYNSKEVAVKDDVPTVSGYADSVKYNSTSHTIEFYHGTTAGTKVFEVDASAFIIDGMVENVEIDDVTSGSSTVKCLIVSFNTDAGKQDINIPISEIFDPDIYYTKEEIDDAELAISSALNDLNDRKLDASAYTPTDLSNYYTKSETSGASQITTALADKVNVSDVVSAITSLNSGSTNPVSTIAIMTVVADNEEVVSSALNDLNERKLDASAYTPTDLSNYYTKSETSGASQISTALNAKTDTATTSALNNVVTAHTANTTIHVTSSDKSAWNAKVDASDLNVYADSVKYNSTSHAIEFYHGTTAGTKVFEVDASAFIIDGMVENVEIDDVTSGSSTVKCLIVSFNTDAGKQDINIPISEIFDPDIYYTKEETSGATQISTALADKVNISDVVSAITPSNSGSTTSPVSVKVVAENEIVMASALNDLNENKLDVTAYTPTEGETIYYLTGMTGAAGGTRLAASWSGNCSSITELYTGLCVRFLIPTAGHASGVTLSINGGEKHKVLYNNTTLTTQYSANTILNLTYDANTSGTYYTGSTTQVTVQGVWRANAEYYYDSNTNTVGYYIGHNQSVYKTDAAAYRYMLLLSKDETTLTPVNTSSNVTASTKTLTTESFNPFGDILYKSSSATTAAGSNIPSGVTWTQYTLDLRYSFNVSTLVPQESVYIVAVPQSDGKAKLYDTTGTTTITQTLPTTADGLIYIYLGQAYSTTNIFLLNNHPIYQYKDGQIRLYTNSSASIIVDQTIDSGTSASTNAVATQAVYNTIKDTELVWTNAYNTLSGVVSSHSSSYVTSMSGYTKPLTTSAISTSDTLNQAVGKLECALGGIRLQSISQSDYDALVTKDPNTLYIITS